MIDSEGVGGVTIRTLPQFIAYPTTVAFYQLGLFDIAILLLYRKNMSRQIDRPRLSIWTAVATAVAFFLAINFCNSELLLPHATHSSHSHDHHEGNREHQTPSHEDTSCCQSIRAIITSKDAFRLVNQSNPLFELSSLRPLWSTFSLVKPLRVVSGLSPPTRAPTPRQPCPSLCSRLVEALGKSKSFSNPSTQEDSYVLDISSVLAYVIPHGERGVDRRRLW